MLFRILVNANAREAITRRTERDNQVNSNGLRKLFVTPGDRHGREAAPQHTGDASRRNTWSMMPPPALLLPIHETADSRKKLRDCIANDFVRLRRSHLPTPVSFLPAAY